MLYELVSTQWLFFEDMTPLFLANTVQETFLQGPKPPSHGDFKVKGYDTQYYEDPRYHPFSEKVSSSCMACHYVATLPKPNNTHKADFSFLLGNAQ